MNKKERMVLKKELKAIAKSDIKIDKEIYTYFMDNVKGVKFTDNEVVYLIHNFIYGYYFEEEDLEIKIVDFLFTQTTIKNHEKFDQLYIDSFENCCNASFELLIKHNIIILPKVILFAESYFKCIEHEIYFFIVQKIDEYKYMLNTLKIYSRKQKIENIRKRKYQVI